MEYVIQFESWASVEARDESQAIEMAKAIINQIEGYANNDIDFSEPFEMVLRLDGIEKVGANE